MKFLYNTIYLAMLLIGLPWLIWRVVVQKKNRTGWQQKLLGLAPLRSNGQPCIWIHAVSVGEVNLLPRLVAQLKEKRPEISIAITSTTETGLELARRRFPDDLVFFCPSDSSWAINNVLDRIRPDMLVLTELELWPNLISETANRNIPVVLINGRVSEKSFDGYRRIQFLIQGVTKKIAFACAQTSDYRQRLMKLGMPAERIHVTGNIKFDNALPVDNPASQSEVPLAKIANFSDDEFVFLAGSTQENEDLLLIELFDKLRDKFPLLRLVLVPRHPDRVHRVEQQIHNLGIPYSLRSQLNIDVGRDRGDKILIVDVIGELAQWWRLADAGFVGGSMGRRGGQNMIEPAALQVPISFGPDTSNFKDVVALLLDGDGARRVADKSELENFIEWTIQEKNNAAEMGRRGHEIVRAQQGAMQRTLATLCEILSRPTERSDDSTSRNAA